MTKIALILTISLVGIFLLFQSYMAMKTDKTNTQKYEVITSGKDYEIRYYPAVTIATIKSSAKTYKELANPGFRKLAKYIFGGNNAKIHISMTSPVHMDISDSSSSMSFVMPAGYTRENLPKPNDSSVLINTTIDEYIAAITFGGYASDKAIKLYAEKLDHALNENSISYQGHFKYLGYNPPYQLFKRRNEVIVTIKWSTK